MNNNNDDNNKTKTTIAFVIVAASFFSYAGYLTNQVFGQSDISSDDSNNNSDNNDNNNSAAVTTTDGNQDSVNYPNFIDCLSESEEIMGYATETDIRDCVGEMYGPSTNVGSSMMDDNDNDDNGNTDNSSNSNNNIDIWPTPQ